MHLSFSVDDAVAMTPAATPTIGLVVTASVDDGTPIHSIALRAQVRIDALRRAYSVAERSSLRDLFGEDDRFRTTLRPLLWTHAQTTLPAFRGTTRFTLPLACTWDFDIAATKLLAGLDEGDVPLSILFAGTAFFASADGRLQAAPLPAVSEARFSLPLSTWRAAMEGFAPGRAGVLVERALLARLERYRRDARLPTLDRALEQLLDGPSERALSSGPEGDAR
jgi:hypothetical protein